MHPMPDRNRGFSLIETVLVIVITGVIAAMVAVFLFKPIVSYFSMNARAELSDAADNALRLYAREVRNALPNSVRVSADGLKLEFIPTVAGARYRIDSNGAGTNPLNFESNDTSFDVFGDPIGVNTTHWAVMYNLGTGITGSDAYAPNGTAAQQLSSNRRQITGVSGNTWTINSSQPFPDINRVPPYRIFAVEQPVLYVCDLTARTLTRWKNYGFSAAIPTTLTGTANIIATDVSDCSFTYDSTVVAQRAGLAVLRIVLTKTTGNDSESVVLTHSAHVNNLP